MRRLDTPGCYRALRGIVLTVVALPFLVLGCCHVQALRMEASFHAAEEAFRRQIERARLIGASYPRVVAFWKRERVVSTDYPPDMSPSWEEPHVLQIDTPNAPLASVGLVNWRSAFEFRFDRNGRLVGYRLKRIGSSF